jgi:hypothetical protein
MTSEQDQLQEQMQQHAAAFAEALATREALLHRLRQRVHAAQVAQTQPALMQHAVR